VTSEARASMTWLTQFAATMTKRGRKFLRTPKGYALAGLLLITLAAGLTPLGAGGFCTPRWGCRSRRSGGPPNWMVTSDRGTGYSLLARTRSRRVPPRPGPSIADPHGAPDGAVCGSSSPENVPGRRPSANRTARLRTADRPAGLPDRRRSIRKEVIQMDPILVGIDVSRARVQVAVTDPAGHVR